ncbi:MAG TPA: hypothetical protein VLY03_12290 [Bacteroidota bacterium]|nr:hypothetical protein [Bacteroidota bacterium]
MKNSTILILLAFLALFAYECSNADRESQERFSSLQQANQQLANDIASRDRFIDTVATSLNDLYVNVENLRAQEKSLLHETTKLESEKNLTKNDPRANLVEKVGAIRSALAEDQKRLGDLRSRLNSTNKKYAGLEKLVENLKATIQERDSSIADLGRRVQNLQGQVDQQNIMLTSKDSVIGSQYKQLTTAYYMMGTKSQLEKMGVITREGGFLWGLLGSTTILADSIDERSFTPLNRLVDNTIQVKGSIEEILPRRNQQFYQQSEVADGSQSLLTISNPDEFWKQKYLVIITSKPNADLAVAP